MSFDPARYQRELAELVAIPSVSCALKDWDTSNRPMIDTLAGWLEELGFAIEILPLPDQPDKANMIATLGQGDGGLVLSGHSDTVPYNADRWHSDPFKLTEKDGKLYGLGATDMKGFFPVVLAAARAAAAEPLKQPLIVLVTADEETSMAGARALADAGRPKARYAVVGEPTRLHPIRQHKGIMMEAVRVDGQSGHSSNPALGKNAIEAMHKVMTELMALRGELQARYRNPGFAVDYPTMNLGCIHGGDGVNRICNQCELHFDFRALPGMDHDDVRRQIRERLKPIAEASGTDVVLSSLFEGVEPFAQDEASELVRVCEELTGHSAESVAFATEAPFLQKLGMDTLVMGPGSIDQAHQPDEFIDTAQIEPAVKIIQELIRRFCL